MLLPKGDFTCGTLAEHCEHEQQAVDTVIIGAGPVGLWFAINMKKRSPDKHIVVYERYDTYQRSHVLRVRRFSLVFGAKWNNATHEDAFAQNIVSQNANALRRNPTGHVYIRTNELESALKTEAACLNIKIINKQIESYKQIIQLHPTCSQFVCADGARSKLREELIGTNATRSKPLQYVVEVKYNAKGSVGKLDPLNEQYKTNKLIKHIGFEHIGRSRNGFTPVTLRFFIDQEIYNALPDATFKQPLSLKNAGIPKSLRESIETYMAARTMFASEAYLEGEVKISKLTLSIYASKRFALQQDFRTFYFVGDAALGVPYFRSLNAGFYIASQLATILSSRLPNRTKCYLFNVLRHLYIAWEFSIARFKNAAIVLYKHFGVLSARLPWEFYKFRNDNDFRTIKP